MGKTFSLIKKPVLLKKFGFRYTKKRADSSARLISIQLFLAPRQNNLYPENIPFLKVINHSAIPSRNTCNDLMPQAMLRYIAFRGVKKLIFLQNRFGYLPKTEFTNSVDKSSLYDIII